MIKEKSDVVIIGSGASALTSAILLLRQGYSVTLLEAHYKPGGYMHSFKKMGHEYDSGAHYVGALQAHEPFWALLNYLDVYNPEVFTPLDEEAFDTFCFQNQKVSQVSYGRGYERVIDHFSNLFPEERSGIKSYFAHLKKIARNFPTYEFLVNYDQSLLLESLETSLKQITEKYIKNNELRNALYVYCGLHGVMPTEVSFGLHSIIVDSLIRSGGYGFRGSGDRLVNEFTQTIEKLGGKIILKEKAQTFEVRHSKVHSVTTQKGHVYSGKQFIFSGHPKDMLSIAGEENFTKPYLSRIKNCPESVGILGVYGVAKRNVLSNIKKNFYHIKSTIPDQLPETRSIHDDPLISFMTFPDRETPDSADELAFSIHAPQYGSWVEPWQEKRNYSRDKDYQKLKMNLSTQLIDYIDSFGFSFKKNTLRFESSTSLTNKRFNVSPHGSAYGIYHSIRYTGARALSGRTKIENLFITGQNTLFPGIMAASVAGLRTVVFMTGIKEHISAVRKLMD